MSRSRKLIKEIIGESQDDAPMHEAGQRARLECAALRQVDGDGVESAADDAIQTQAALPAPDDLKHLPEAGGAGAQGKKRQQYEQHLLYVSEHQFRLFSSPSVAKSPINDHSLPLGKLSPTELAGTGQNRSQVIARFSENHQLDNWKL